MKILQVIDTLNPGGAERVLIDLSNVLTARGHQVAVLTVLEAGPLASDLNPSIEIICLSRKNKFNISKAIQFIRTLNAYEVVHIHMRHVLNYFWFCSFLKQFRAKVFFHDHFGDIEFDQKVPAYLYALRNRIIYIGVSRQLCEWASNKIRIEKHKIFFLGNIITLIPEKKQQAVVKLKDTLKIVLISNFRRTKNIEFAINLMAILKHERNIQLDIYGRDQDKLYLNELQDLSRVLGVTGNVNFLLNRLDIRYKLKDYDMALHCAYSETGPLVLIEYIASHLPFVAFETGEVPAQLSPHFPDFFMSNFEKASWISRIQQIANANFSSMAIQFDEVFNMYYSIEAYGDNIQNIYSTGIHAL